MEFLHWPFALWPNVLKSPKPKLSEEGLSKRIKVWLNQTIPTVFLHMTSTMSNIVFWSNVAYHHVSHGRKIPVSTASTVCSKGTSTNYNRLSHTNLKIDEGAESCHSHVPYLHQCDSVVSTKSQHFTPTISCKHSQAWAWKKVGQTSKKAGGGPRRIVIQMNNSYCLISSWCHLPVFNYYFHNSRALRAEIT